ncbi:flagellar biosynthesis protein FliQ [bacterium]|nr:flagellar biosynthesis protein FliQ [bacterium]
MQEFIIGIGKQALFLTLIMTAPPVLTALLVGLTISILQATTQVQEQTLTFVPKLVSVIVVIGVTGPWMMAQLVTFAQSIYGAFPSYIH